MPYAALDPAGMPFVVLADQRRALPWHHGPHFSRRMAAGFTRLNAFGLLHGRSQSSRLQEGVGSWRSEACRVSHEALCEQRQGNVSAMLFFPVGAVEIPEDFSGIPRNSFTDTFPNGSSCTHARSGRSVNQQDQRYEVSLCDLLDARLDVVFDHPSGRVFWRQDSTGLATQLFVCVLAVYIVSCVAENIKNIISNRDMGVLWPQHAALVVTVVFTGVELWRHELLAYIVSSADLRLFYVLYGYAVLEALLQFDVVCVSTMRSFISPLTTCLFLLMMRIYYTFDTAYTLPLTMLFGTRNWFKFLCVHSSGAAGTPASLGDRALLLLDLLVFATLLTDGMLQHASSSVDAVCDQILVLTVSTLMGTVLFIYSFVFEAPS